jgi:hypothetical protein
LPDIDDFATSLLEEAKRFLEKAVEESEPAVQNAYLHAGLLLAFSSLEAHVNAIAEEFAGRPELTPHERGILLEKEIYLKDGEFRIGGLRMYRLTDRIEFLHNRFTGTPLDKASAAWWSDLGNATDLRNKLTHPKEAQVVSVESVRRATHCVIDAIDALYQAIYGKKFPAANRGLQSRMEF